MKRALYFLLPAISLLAAPAVFAQGWRATVVLNFNGLTSLASVDYATITFPGGAGYASLQASSVQMEIIGKGDAGGPFQITAAGRPWENSQTISYISVASSLPITTNCQLYSLDEDPAVNQYVSGWIMIFPRQNISEIIEDCNRVTLTTDICSDAIYRWEASESVSGSFRVITESWAPSVAISGDQLAAAGLSRYGRKFFRVTGGINTTSPVAVADFYWPGPSASFLLTAPTCHDGSDGTIKMDIASSDPSLIDDFIITVTPQDNRSRIRQFTLDNSSWLLVEGLEPGNYNVQIMNHSNTEMYGQCWTDFDIGPIANPAKVSIASVEVSNHNGYQVTCADADDGELSVHPTGGTGSYTAFLWTPAVSTTENAFNLTAGTYKVRVKDSNNCWSDDHNETLSAPEKLQLDLESTGGKGGFDVSCHNKSDGEVTALMSGGIPYYAYLWSTGDTTSKLAAADTGTYDLKVTDRNGCVAAASLTLRAPQPIDFSIREVSTLHCAGDESAILAVEALVNTIGPVHYSWSSGETRNEIVNKGAGTYSLRVTDEQGCQQTRYATLDDPPRYSSDITASSDFNGSYIRCHGEANGILTSVFRDEDQKIVPAENYSWYRNDNEFLEEGVSNSVLQSVPAGAYTVKMRYHGVCESETTFILHEPAHVTPVIHVESDYNGVPISCHGASDGSLRASSLGGTGGTYSWRWSSGEDTAVLTGLSAGKYSVTATDLNGCMGTSEKVLSEPPPVEAMIAVVSDYNGQPLTCTGASDARLRGSAKGGTPLFRYTWSTGKAGPDLTDIPAGDYAFTAVDANGCSAIKQLQIANPIAVKAEIAKASDFHGFGVSCNGAADGFILANGAGGTGIYTYSWNGGEYTAASYQGLHAGPYTVTVTDQNGCHDIALKEIIEPPKLTLEVSEFKNVSCHGGEDGEIRLLSAGGAGDYRYTTSGLLWQPEPLLDGLKAQLYDPVVADANGCEQSTSLKLTQPPPLSIVFEDLEAALCGDPRGQVSARTTGGTGAHQYEWSNSRGEFVSDAPHIHNLSAGVYTLKVTDVQFCQKTESVGISSTDGPRIQVTDVISPTCSYTYDGSALVEVTQGNGPYTYHWSDGQDGQHALNLGKGYYFVEVSDVNQCSAIASFLLGAPDSLRIKILEAEEPTCYLACDGKLVVGAEGGTGKYIYEWETFAGAHRDQLCAGEYNVVATDQSGCVAGKTVVLNEPRPLEIRLVSAKPPDCQDDCNGRMAIASNGGTGAVEYTWSTGEKGPLIDKLCAGSYTATIMDANHCMAEEIFVMENPATPQLDLGGSVTLCEGQTHILDPGNFWEEYLWTSTAGFRSDQQRITIATSGSYSLTAVTSQGCVARDTFFLETSKDLLEANFLLGSEAMIQDTIVIIDISWPLPENSIWRFPEEMDRLLDLGDIVYGKFDRHGRYEIGLTAILGDCTDEITKTVTILDNQGPTDEGRLSYRQFIKEFDLYPNPNDGMFDVKVVLEEPGAITLTIWNTLTSTTVGKFEASDRDEYLMHIDVRPLSAGTYVIRLDTIKGTRYLRFMVK